VTSCSFSRDYGRDSRPYITIYMLHRLLRELATVLCLVACWNSVTFIQLNTTHH